MANTVSLEDISADITIIKRNGSEEKYSTEKMKNFLLKVCNGKETYADIINKKTLVKINKGSIKIQDLIDLIINTTLTEVSMLYPEFDEIAARLYITKMRKDINNSFEYPHLKDTISNGLKAKVYGSEYFNTYTDEDIEYFNSIIDTDRDFLFNSYKAIKVFHEKYCLKKSKTIFLELPQHVYMRVAMFLNYKEPFITRQKYVKDTYDMISKHLVSMATPIMINSGVKNPQMSSCVLTKVDDDTYSILKAANSIAIYSKFKGAIIV